MENQKNILRTATDYAGKLEELKHQKRDGSSLIIHGRYKAALGQIILNEFLDGTNERPEEFTKEEVITAIHQAGGRTFRDYEYDGHRRDPTGNFVDEILDGCIRQNMRLEKHNELYRRKILDVLNKKEEQIIGEEE